MMTKYEYSSAKQVINCQKINFGRSVRYYEHTQSESISRLQFLRSLYVTHQAPEYQNFTFTLISRDAREDSSRGCLSHRGSPSFRTYFDPAAGWAVGLLSLHVMRVQWPSN